MKRFGLLGSAVFVAVTVASESFGQGFLSANNQYTTPLTVINQFTGSTNIVGAPGSPLGPGSVLVTLWIAANGAPLNSLQMVAVGTNSTSTLTAAVGTFNLGNPFALAAPWDGTSKIELLYRAWNIYDGATSIQDIMFSPGYHGPAYSGQSALLTDFSLGTGVQVPPATFGPGLLQGITLALVPEPSTLTLLGIGAVVLFQMRRAYREHIT
jgi:hypothetical protein